MYEYSVMSYMKLGARDLQGFLQPFTLICNPIVQALQFMKASFNSLQAVFLLKINLYLLQDFIHFYSCFNTA